MKLSEQYHVGQEVRAWSQRTMVPCHFTITKVGTKWLQGTFAANGKTWKGINIHPNRILP